MKTEEEEERERMRQRKCQSSPYEKRFGADSLGNDRTYRKLVTFDRGVLGHAEKRHRADNTNVRDIC